jgi:hypothetical protein
MGDQSLHSFVSGCLSFPRRGISLARQFDKLIALENSPAMAARMDCVGLNYDREGVVLGHDVNMQTATRGR